MLINRIFAIFCLLSLVFLVVGLCIASANPDSERSQKWGAVMWAARWVLLVVFLILFVIRLIFN